jgi:hypothetical protein
MDAGPDDVNYGDGSRSALKWHPGQSRCRHPTWKYLLFCLSSCTRLGDFCLDGPGLGGRETWADRWRGRDRARWDCSESSLVAELDPISIRLSSFSLVPFLPFFLSIFQSFQIATLFHLRSSLLYRFHPAGSGCSE